jgi:hypothetical protein
MACTWDKDNRANKYNTPLINHTRISFKPKLTC